MASNGVTDNTSVPAEATVAEAVRATSITDAEKADVITKEHVQKYSKTDDEAMKAFAEYDGPPLVMDSETNKRLLRTIDWHVMPLMCLIFGLNYLDKTAISYGSIMGLKEDLNLQGDNYQWLGSIFYIGFMVWEIPTSRALAFFPLAKYTSFCVTTWGAVLAFSAMLHNYEGAMASRFFLGVLEAASMPAFALFSSQWYSTNEHNTRSAFFIGANGWAQIIGGGLAYGIADRVEREPGPIAGWKIIFIGIGCFTAIVGILFLFVIPDSPLKARWLSKRDRLLAIERIRENEQGIGNRQFKWSQVKETMVDPLFWALFAYGVLSDIPNGGITNFFSQLIVSFGYTKKESLLYGMPGGAVVIVACIVNGFLGDYLKRRTLVAIIPMTAAAIGILLIIILPLENNTGRLIGYYLTQCLPAPGATVLSLISSNIAGYTRKTTVAAIYMVGYCLGNVIGPQTFRPEDAPRYVRAEIIILVCFGLCILDFLFIFWYCRRENMRKAAIRASPGYVPIENAAWKDLTDKENPEFIYAL